MHAYTSHTCGPRCVCVCLSVFVCITAEAAFNTTFYISISLNMSSFVDYLSICLPACLTVHLPIHPPIVYTYLICSQSVPFVRVCVWV